MLIFVLCLSSLSSNTFFSFYLLILQMCHKFIQIYYRLNFVDTLQYKCRKVHFWKDAQIKKKKNIVISLTYDKISFHQDRVIYLLIRDQSILYPRSYDKFFVLFYVFSPYFFIWERGGELSVRFLIRDLALDLGHLELW